MALFDFIELLRRAATRPDVGFAIALEIASLRLPFVALQILPFSILLGGIVAFWRLTRSSELIVARAAGISAWGFLTGPLVVAMLLGMVATGAISPISSALLSRAERLDQTFLRTGGGMTALAGGRLWLRQADRELEANGVAILSGRPVAMRAPGEPIPRAGARFELQEVSVWRLTAGDQPLSRIEAPRARLTNGAWVIEDAVAFGADRIAKPVGTISLPTELTPDRIQAASPPRRHSISGPCPASRGAGGSGFFRRPPPHPVPDAAGPAGAGAGHALLAAAFPCARPGAAALRR